MPLSDWFAESVRAALIRELGSLPTEEPEFTEPEPEAPETGSAISSAERDEPPAETLEREPPPSQPIPSVTEYRARRMSLEAQRLAASGLSGWLATRIEGLPAGGLPAAPSAPKAAPPAPSGPHVPPKPQLDLFHVVPPKAAPLSAVAPPVAPLAPLEAPELPAVLPLSLPSGPIVSLALSALRPPRIRARQSSGVDRGIAALAASVAAQGVREPILVRRLAEDAAGYEVVAGERRRLAAERAGRADLPAAAADGIPDEPQRARTAPRAGAVPYRAGLAPPGIAGKGTPLDRRRPIGPGARLHAAERAGSRGAGTANGSGWRARRGWGFALREPFDWQSRAERPIRGRPRPRKRRVEVSRGVGRIEAMRTRGFP